jgi:hypothetical protein
MPDHVTPIRSTTQKFTEIEDIQNDLVLYSDGSSAAILSVSAVNFSLLSQREQEAMIYAYAGVLNSLSFPVQLIIRSQHKDIRAYLKLLEDQEAVQKNPKLQKSIHGYRNFVAATVKEKEVLDKKFYLVIPFSALELGVSPSVFFGSKKRGLPFKKSYIFERALVVLTPKIDNLIRLLAKVGLHAKQLTGEQVAQLYFSFYNPDIPAPMIELKKNRSDITIVSTLSPKTT